MHAHAKDFRSEVPGPEGERVAAALVDDWRRAPLDAADRALCEHAEKLTLRPHAMREADLRPLHEAGLDDRAIHDATQVIAYFNYIIRVADGLGVDLEPDMPPRPRPHAESSETEDAVAAAGEAMAPCITDTGTMTIVWKCLRCNHHLPAGSDPPAACPSCGAPRTEFALVEED